MAQSNSYKILVFGLPGSGKTTFAKKLAKDLPYFNNDDVIYISGREARIVRVGITKTVFYMTDRKTKMIVPNEKLKDLTMEKILTTGHHLAKGGYLPKSTDELSEKEKQGLHAVAEEISVRDQND